MLLLKTSVDFKTKSKPAADKYIVAKRYGKPELIKGRNFLKDFALIAQVYVRVIFTLIN